MELKNVEDFTTKHLMDLYGINPNIFPYAFQFPRLPPKLTHSRLGFDSNSIKEKSVKKMETMNIKLQDFRQMYQDFASGLLNMTSPGLIPPGHPLFSRERSIETLRSENNKLLKENLELKKKLEKSTKNKSQIS